MPPRPHPAGTPRVLFALLAILLLAGCQTQPSRHGHAPPLTQGEDSPHTPMITTATLDLRHQPDPTTLVDELLKRPLIYIGESHTNMAHHAKQLELIQAIHQADPRLLIGMEMFQLPAQPHLDRFIAGEINQQEMLLATQWYDRWGYDYLLYKAILDFAAAQRIAVIALNVPKETLARIRTLGLDGLSEEELSPLGGQIDRSNQAYSQRLKEVFHRHPGSEKKDFERFVDIQLSWDEGMAESAAQALARHPDHRMVILAGSGHLAHGDGIPSRLERRTGLEGSILLPGNQVDVTPGVADFLYYSPALPAPKRASMGVLLKDQEQGLLISRVFPHSAAMAAGIEDGDLLLSINGQPVKDSGELKVRLLEQQPGDVIELHIQRTGLFGKRRNHAIRLTLGDGAA